MTAEQLAEISEIVERRLGLRADDKRDILDGVLARRRDAGLYLARLAAGDAAELGALAAELVVGETYFYRHVEQLRAFAEVVAPERAAARGGRIAVLSAGCATGEEPYTLAMMLHGAVAADIAAVDVHPGALASAARGVYSSWALRAVPALVRERWFAPAGAAWSIAREIREAVAFHAGSILDEGPLLAPGRWDAIFCRNVTMYFTEPCARAVYQRFARALAPGGYLFLGHAETLRGRSEEFELCHSHGTFYYRRGESAAAPAPAPWYDQIRDAS
ncbi:MAG: protein-glutamate O-methyltransferase, partial [Deltaproteobacteria bacterium]|nr:protein-glutamate O-methyltransferase [Deltaproteobacteria bacterium]